MVAYRDKLDLDKSLPGMPHRRCPRGQLGSGGGSGSCSSLGPPCNKIVAMVSEQEREAGESPEVFSKGLKDLWIREL
jgi:hypothetical protein